MVRRIIIPRNVYKEYITTQEGENPAMAMSNQGIDLFYEIQAAIDNGSITLPGGPTSTETNLSISSRTSTSIVVSNDNGDGLTLPPVNSSEAGLMTAADKVKLDGIIPYTHPDHIGDVVSLGDGATTISANAVTNTKLADMLPNTVKIRRSLVSGDPMDVVIGVNQILGRGSISPLGPLDLGPNLVISGNIIDAVTGVADGDKIDITVAGSNWTINNGVVNFAKMQNISTDRILGRDSAGTGSVEELLLTGGLEFTGTGSIRISAFTGDVTKPAGSTVQTIANNAVTNQKLADMPAFTIKGNNLGTSNDPIDLTPSQVKALIQYLASEITNVPSGNIIATNLQNAINELDNEKHVRIQFQDEGVNLGAAGSVDTINFTGSPITVTRVGNVITIDITGSGGGGGATNLSEGLRTATTVNVNSDTGSDATLNPATSSLAGVMPAGDKQKVDHITVTQAVNLDDLESDVNDLTTLSGVVSNATNLGTFTGTIINDNRTIKQALQDLETGIENKAGVFEYDVPITGGSSGSAVRVVATQTGITASFSANTLTFSSPTTGNRILSVDWRLVAADVQASADAGGSTNWIKVVFQGTGGNTGVSDLRIPTVQKSAIPASGTISATNAISLDLDNNPAISIVGVGSGSVTIRVAGLSVGTQGYHLKFTNI